MAKRPSCRHCGRPLSVCLCDAVTVKKAPLQLIIWQEPTEAKHPLSTAPLLAKSIEGARFFCAEHCCYEDIFSALPLHDVALLYPFDKEPAVTEKNKKNIKALLILDGTWRKVRKLILQNPWLQDVPNIALNPTENSRYYIRTSQRTDGVSTIEAGAEVLNWLTDSGEYSGILSVLDRLVEIQQGFGHKKD